MNTTLQENIFVREYNTNQRTVEVSSRIVRARPRCPVFTDVAAGHRQSMRRAWHFFARQVIAPRREHYPTEGCRHSIALLAAQQLARAAITAKRTRAGYNPLIVAHDMAFMAATAPADTPCALDRLGFERIVLDMLHLAHEQGGAA